MELRILTLVKLNMPSNKSHQQSMIYEVGFTLKEIEPSISQVRILSGGRK